MFRFFVLIGLFLGNFLIAQNLVFENQELKSYLVNEICADTDGDGIIDSDVDINNDNEIQLSEALATTFLTISGGSYTITEISDLSQFINIESLSLIGGFDLLEVSNLNLNSLQYLRISSFSNINVIDLSDLPNLDNIEIEGVAWVQNLNLKNGSVATEFSLFYTNARNICVDDIPTEVNAVQQWLYEGATLTTDCSNLSTTESVEKEIAIVYPNPTNDELFINKEYIQVLIYNMSGEIVREFHSNQPLKIQNLPKGSYAIEVLTKEYKVLKTKILKK